MADEKAEKEIERLRSKLAEAEATRDRVIARLSMVEEIIIDLCEKVAGPHTGCSCCRE